MTEIKRHIQHVKSKVVENGKPKLPTESQIFDGEIAVNYAKDYETLSIKNEEGTIVTFSSDNVFIEKYVEPNERVVAEALNDLNASITAHTSDTQLHFTAAEKEKLGGIEDEANKTVVDNALSETSTNPIANNAVYAVIKNNEEIVANALTDLDSRLNAVSGDVENNEEIVAAALNDLNGRVGNLTKVEASSVNGNIVIDDVETVVYTLPQADDETLGGVMVDLELDEESDNVVANSAITKAIVDNERVVAEALNDLNASITAHTSDSGIHLTSEEKTKLDSIEEGATKIEVVNGNGLTFNDATKELSLVVDTALSSASTNVVSNKAIFDAIKDTEEIIANSLNDLDSRVNAVSGDVENNEEIVAAALNDLNGRVGNLTKVEASSINGNIVIDDDETVVYTLPQATNSTIGGVMVDSDLDEESDNVVVNSAITKAIVDNERVVAEALNDLNASITAHTSDTQLHFTAAEKEKLGSIESGATKITVDQTLTSASTNPISSKGVYDVIKDNEEIVANALTDLDGRIATLGDKVDGLSFIENTTYSQLVALKASSGLTQGMLYRITDYVTTTTQASTQSAGHPFDVIVLATSTSSLSENAWAIQHDGDTYFSTSNLNAWEIKYCLENDANRFAWADTTNGKGVIFHMKDEYNNECPYDFKNIMYNYSNITIDGLVLNGNYYTFSFSGQTIQDASIVCQTIDGGDNKVIGVHDNSIGLSTTYDVDISSNRLMFALSKNAFVAADLYLGNVFYGICGNKLGCGCHDNIFGEASINNFIGNYSFGNLFGNKCQYNTLGASCYNNNFGSDSSNNILGTNCILNTFNGSSNITFGNQCSGINLSSGCKNITIGNDCTTVTFGKSGSRNIIVENGNSNITINTNESTLKDITILQGCSNKTIAHSGTFPTTYKLSGSTITEI